jgi:hypothetical protein
MPFQVGVIGIRRRVIAPLDTREIAPSCATPWSGAAIGGAQREILSELALFDQIGQHGDYGGVRARSLGADEVEAEIAA